MRILKVSLPLILVISFLLPVTLMAQAGGSKPACCPKRSLESTPSIQGQFVMSDQMLRSQGITRIQYVNQLSTIVFPNKAVDIVFPSSPKKANGTALDTVELALTDGILHIGVKFVR